MSQKTHCIFITNDKQLTLIRAIIVVYSENHSKCIKNNLWANNRVLAMLKQMVNKVTIVPLKL